MIHRVFVYGTLKRGEPNHHWFTKEEGGAYKFLSDATTIEKYPLIIGTKYNIPFLLYKSGVGNHVRGELYEVDDKVFANLDILEDHPNFYIREKQQVKSAAGDIVDTWIYFIKNFRPELLQQEMYECYSNSGSHGRVYVDRYLRDPSFSIKSGILDTPNEN